MKKYPYFISFIFLLWSSFLSAQATELENLTPKDLWNLVIKHYDPADNWGQVEGSLHLNNISPNGALTSEDIILNNKFDIYQNFLFRGDTVIMRKKDQREASFSVNGKTRFSSKDKAKLKLMPNDIDFIKRRHLFEIGLPMYLKDANIQFTNEIKKGTFGGVDCLVLESIGTSSAKKRAYPFIQQPIFYYINRTDFSFLGMEFPTEIKRQNIPGFRIVFSGEITLNGIKIPQVKNYFHYKTGAYLYTTTLNILTRKDHVNNTTERKLIEEQVKKESKYFGMRNFTKWSACWSPQEDIYQSYVTKDGYTINEGWQKVSQFAKDFFLANPDPHFLTIEPTNFSYHIYGKIAWVYFDSPAGSLKQGRHQRILRKENGEWKIINWTGFDEFSYQTN